MSGQRVYTSRCLGCGSNTQRIHVGQIEVFEKAHERICPKVPKFQRGTAIQLLTEELEQPVPTRANREGDSQGLPTKNDLPCVQDQVIADIESRKAVGIERYGTVLQPHNGRNALVDAYEEALDLAIYLKQALYEQDNPS